MWGLATSTRLFCCVTSELGKTRDSSLGPISHWMSHLLTGDWVLSRCLNARDCTTWRLYISWHNLTVAFLKTYPRKNVDAKFWSSWMSILSYTRLTFHIPEDRPPALGSHKHSLTTMLLSSYIASQSTYQIAMARTTCCGHRRWMRTSRRGQMTRCFLPTIPFKSRVCTANLRRFRYLLLLSGPGPTSRRIQIKLPSLGFLLAWYSLVIICVFDSLNISNCHQLEGSRLCSQIDIEVYLKQRKRFPTTVKLSGLYVLLSRVKLFD